MKAQQIDSRGGDGGRAFVLGGRHVFLMLALFFGVVFAVNGYMLRVAVGTFSGVQTETPYKMGLAYNTRIAASKEQDQRGWKVEARVVRAADGAASVILSAFDREGNPLSGLGGRIRLERPADKRLDRASELAATGTGRYGAELQGVVAGQWDVVVLLERGGDVVFESTNRVLLP